MIWSSGAKQPQACDYLAGTGPHADRYIIGRRVIIHIFVFTDLN